MAENEFGLTAFARKTPDKAFTVFNDRRITYGEADRRVNRLANGLKSLGIDKSHRIAILSHNNPEYLEVSQACAKLKAMLVPINYRLKEDEVEYVVNNSESRAIFCDASLVDLVRSLQPKLKNIQPDCLFVIGGEAEGMNSYDEFISRFPDTEPDVKNPHIFGGTMGYTSGTTGFPKGVYREKPPIDMSVHIIREFGLSGNDVHIVVGPFYHSAPIATANWGMMMGTTIVIMERMDARKCLELIQKEKVTTTFMAPILIKYLFDLPQEELKKYDVSSMQRIIVAGAPCPFELKKQVVDYFGEGVLLEFYGSTDGGMNTILKPEDQLRKPNSIGTLFPENEILIVDENDNPLPPNKTGEFLIYNPWLLDTYYGDEEFAKKSMHGKYWRSGDMGYVDEEGYYYIVDRCKDMILSGGVNIYPAEIERVLAENPDIFDCCVLGVPDSKYGESVKAVIQLKKGGNVSEDDLSRWMKEKLADYKRPKSIDIVESLPRDMNGKIMKRYLRDEYWAGEKKKV